MHGGAPGSGAPRGNKNALKYGLYTREAIEERRQLRALMRQSCMLIQDIERSTSNRLAGVLGERAIECAALSCPSSLADLQVARRDRAGVSSNRRWYSRLTPKGWFGWC